MKVTFLTVFLIFATSEALECVNVAHPKIRVFESLTKYKFNIMPFDSRLAQSKGNSIEFESNSINILSRNTFITYQSEFLIKINLSRKQIESIQSGAFESLTCLQILDLSHNRISKLENRNIFKGMPDLKELNLSFNNLTEVKDLTFTTLLQLRILNLSHNKVQNLEFMGLYNLTNLEQLFLQFNKLQEFDENIFVPAVRLNTLNLATNQLNSIEPEKWKGLPVLEILSLADNELYRFDGSEAFAFKNLKFLNLSYNNLVELNVLGMRINLPKLISIDINDNRWLCKNLVTLVKDLAVSNIKVIQNNRSKDHEFQGISCENTPPKFAKHTEESSTISRITATSSEVVNFTTKLNQILQNSSQMILLEKQILDTAQFIQIMILILFLIVVFCIIFKIYVKYNCCVDIHRRFVSINQENEVEHFHLINACR